MRKQARLIGATLFAVGALVHSSAVAEEKVMSTGADWAPFSDETLPGGGYGTQMVTAVLDAMGIDYQVEIMPWARAYRQAMSGNVYATFLWFDSEERREEAIFSDPVYTVETNVIMAADANADYSSLDDLNGVSVCMPDGYTIMPALAERVETGAITLIAPKDLAACVKMVTAGRADAIVQPSVVTLFEAERAGVDRSAFRVLPVPVTESPLYFLISKETEGGREFMDDFNAAMKRIQQEGAFDAIVNET